MKIIILGPPGSGKGVQSRFIKDFFGVEIVSVGELLRKEIKSRTELGIEIESMVKNGLLVDERIVCNMVKYYIDNYNNILLDGFPRTLNQIMFLDKINFDVDIVIKLNINNVTLFKRVKYRLISPESQATYNVIYNRPKIKDLDDLSGDKLIPRTDDKYSTLLSRIDLYNNEIANVISYFSNKNVKIVNIDSVNDKYLVFNQIKDTINNEQLL